MTRPTVADVARLAWVGPDDADLAPGGVSLRGQVPHERWPYGPPNYHEACRRLHRGGLFCDCKASDASDTEWGDAP